MDKYEALVERVCRASGLEKEEIDRRVEAKRAKLSGLVSKEGAAQIVAAELGISFDQEKLKIKEINDGMRRVNTLGKVINISPVREFNKNGREGKVVNLIVADDSGNVRVVLWDTNHIYLIEQGKIKQGDVVEIANGNVRTGEIHLGSFSDIKLSKEKIENVIEHKVYESKKFKEVKAGDALKIRAIIVQAFEPRYFEVCPECKKKATEGECAIHGKVESEKRALINIVLDDGTETMRAVLFGEDIKKLGLTDEEIFDIHKFEAKKLGLLGEEKIFLGNIRTNVLYNITEFNVNGVDEINTDELIKELETKTG